MKAVDIIRKAADIVGGDRNRSHGDKMQSHQNIAALWNAYLEEVLDRHLTPKDVAVMMVLLKVARTKTGEFNLDDYIDMVGYAGIAGDLASIDEPAPTTVKMTWLQPVDPMTHFESTWTGPPLHSAVDQNGYAVWKTPDDTVVFRLEQ